MLQASSLLCHRLPASPHHSKPLKYGVQMFCRFHHISYGARIWCIAALMSAAYTTVAFGQSRAWQLLGVVYSALQGGLGEASCLAMCTFFDSRSAITFWASGTGFAGGERHNNSSHAWHGCKQLGISAALKSLCYILPLLA